MLRSGKPQEAKKERGKGRGRRGLRSQQEGGVGRDEKKERKERKVFPATTHASKDTPKEERRRYPAMTKASRDTQGGRKEREKERKKERGRERERREKEKGRCSQLRTSASRDTPKKERGDPECCIQESPRKQRKKGGREGGEGG